jgi:glycosyltransferase involved in cell wall biosynthesis
MVQFGYLPKREDYIRTVRQADIVVSTALEEFFSPPAVEAIAAGLYPLLPGRLSYPEIIPEKWHREFLYRDDRGLRSRLIRLLDGKADWVPARQMSRHIQSYDWHNLIRKCDDALARAAAGSED